MAARKQKPLKGNGRDGVDYAAFITGVLDGSILATRLVETTVPDGTEDIHVPQRDAQGNPLPDQVVTVQKRRLTKLEYDEP
jgi:hypothetical protein